MKKSVLTSIVALGLLWPLAAPAQFIDARAVLNKLALTNNLDSAVTDGVPNVLVGGYASIAVQLIVSNTAASTSNTLINIQKSLDGNNWIQRGILTVAGAGTITTSCISNFTNVGDRYWRFTVTNGFAPAFATNYVTIWISKSVQ